MSLVQGNGTSAIFSSDERVTTFDVHGKLQSQLLCSSMKGRWVSHSAFLVLRCSMSDKISWMARLPSMCIIAGDRNYPWKTRMQSTYDIALPDATNDTAY